MKALRKPLSLLLSLIMVCSMFTVIPATTASAASVQVFARKWVEAENVTGDYFSFTDLYQNFIICRGNPSFDETNYNVDDTTNVYNRTGNISLGNYNEIRLNSWNDGYGHLGFYTTNNGSALGDGKIYLSTNGDNDMNFNTDGVTWYAYTWETFTADSVEEISPTYRNGVYEHGTAAHYTAGDRKFVAVEGTTDGNQNVRQVEDAQLVVPYFRFAEHGFGTQSLIKLEKCNSDDAEIIVPETIPSNYPNEAWNSGTVSFAVIAGGAFANCTNLEKITIGDNVNHIGSDYVDDVYLGAFDGCTNLKEVYVGSGLEYLEEYCFENCSSLELFQSTTMKQIAKDRGLLSNGTPNLINVKCYHDSDLFKKVYGSRWFNVTYLDDPVTHTYHQEDIGWDWTPDDDDADHLPQVTAYLSCEICGEDSEQTATVTKVADPDATCTVDGTYQYIASITVNGQAFTDHDDSFDETITTPGHTPETEGTYANLYEYRVDNGQAQLRRVNRCSVCESVYYGDWFNVTHYPSQAVTCTTDGQHEYCKDESNRCYLFRSNDGQYLFTQGDSGDVVIAAGHILTAHPAKAATVGEDGNTAYWSCERCGKYFSDENGTNEITDHDSVILPKTAVAYIAGIGDGYYTDQFADAVIQAKNHHDAIIELLKDTTLDYNTHDFAAGYPTFKVKLNGHTLTVNTLSSDAYTVSTEGPDGDGVTTYTITHTHYWKTEWNDEHPVHREGCWDVDVDFICMYCGETRTVKAQASDDSVTTVAATCTQGGYKEAIFTGNIGSTYSSKTIRWDEADPLGHNLHHTAAAAPSFQNGTYIDGNSECWRCERCGKYYSDEAAENEMTRAEVVIPYFVFTRNSSDNEIGVSGYNGTDATVIIPDKVPDHYFDETLRGLDVDYVHFTAFRSNTNITKVVMGDKIKHIGWEAFRGCSSLKEVEIGSGLVKIDSGVFYGCTSLEKITCTATGEGIAIAYYCFDDDARITFCGYHSGSFRRATNQNYLSNIQKTYIGIDAHTYEAVFNWNGYACTDATVSCTECDLSATVDATVAVAVTTPATTYSDGLRTYTATAVYDGQTFTATKTEVIPSSGVKYLDENDDEQTAYHVLPITADTTALSAGWYCVEGKVTVNRTITMSGDVKIILTDDSELTLAGNLGSVNDASSLIIYRQSGDHEGVLRAAEIYTGAFALIGGSVNASESVRVDHDIDICGGVLSVKNNTNQNAVVSNDGDVTIYDGEVSIKGNTCILATEGTITISGGDTILEGFGSGMLADYVVITGGKLHATASDSDFGGKGIKSYHAISLSWTNATDYCFSDGYDNTVTILKPFKDQNDKLYITGSIAGSALESKGLTPASAAVIGNTISFKDEIAVNFYAYIDDARFTDSISATYSYGTGSYALTHTDLTATITPVSNPANYGGANYKISCMVNARAMTDKVALTVKNGDEVILTDAYSVTDYSTDAATAYAENTALKKLLCDMLDYGAEVQKYFNYENTEETLASHYIPTVDPTWERTPSDDTIADATDYAAVTTEAFGYEYLGSTMTVTSRTTIRLFFDKTDAQKAENTTVAIDGVAYEMKYNATYDNYYIEISGLVVKKVFDTITLTFANGSASATMTYHAASYYNGAPDSFKSVVQALYQYSSSAKAVFV